MKESAHLSSTSLTLWALRISLAAAYLAAVADRLGWCGPAGAENPNVAWGAWQPFVDYTAVLLPFLPGTLIQFSAVAATVAEVVLPVWLLAGWRLRWAGYASAALLLLFALSMVISLGWKAPLNYSVFTGVAASLAVSALASCFSRSALSRHA